MATVEPIDWGLAERVGRHIAGRISASAPLPDPGLPRQFSALVALAEPLVAAETGLTSLCGPAHSEVLSRVDWVSMNVASFRRLLTPAFDRWLSGKAPLGRTARMVSRRVGAVELGSLLGWMSARVLGQYDMLAIGDDSKTGDSTSTGDVVYIVGPNIQAIERRFDFDPEQFRLWVAAHECTHRAQFTGVSWMRGHFASLVDDVVGSINASPSEMVVSIRDAVGDRAAARERLRDGGVMAVVASPETRLALGRIGGLMALLEGHGDVMMTRALGDAVSDAERFAAVLSARRANASPVARWVQRLSGLEAKLNQYAAGERFIAEIESSGGPTVLNRAWESPVNLPSIDEIRAPQSWLDRVASSTASTSSAGLSPAPAK